MTLAIGPLFIMPMVLFGGLMSNNKAQFDWLSWFQYLSPFKYGAEAIITNELKYDKYNVRDPLKKQLDYNLSLIECLLIMLLMVFVMRFLSFLFFIRLAYNSNAQ